MALAYYKQGDLTNAKEQFELILKTAPGDSLESREAASYLSDMAPSPEHRELEPTPE